MRLRREEAVDVRDLGGDEHALGQGLQEGMAIVAGEDSAVEHADDATVGRGAENRPEAVAVVGQR